MKLFHLVAVRKSPYEIREEIVSEEELGHVKLSLSRRYESVFTIRQFNGTRDDHRASTKG